MADRIRAENEAVQNGADQNKDGQATPGVTPKSGCNGTYAFSTIAVRWHAYVCETPDEIEQRIGAIARAVQKAL